MVIPYKDARAGAARVAASFGAFSPFSVSRRCNDTGEPGLFHISLCSSKRLEPGSLTCRFIESVQPQVVDYQYYFMAHTRMLSTSQQVAFIVI